MNVRPAIKLKQKKTEELSSLISQYRVVGISDLTKLPARQLHDIKKKLRGKAVIRVSKKSILQRALEKHENLKGLLENLGGQPAIVLTNESPFKLSGFLQRNKSRAAAKAGDVAVKDIVAPAGLTNAQAGPAIGIFKKFKIDTKVTQGKIEISKDKTIAHQGDKIDSEMASLFQMLGLEPMEVTLNLAAAVENEMLYTKDALMVNEDQVAADVQRAYQDAFNLAFNAEIIMKENIELFVSKAYREANAVKGESKFGESAQSEAQAPPVQTQDQSGGI